MFRPTMLGIALLLIAALILGAVAVAVPDLAQAQESAPLHPEAMASYYPSGTELFVSIRVDEAFADQIDQLFRMVTGAFAAYDVPTVSMRDLFMQGNFDLNSVLSWLGDYAAIGVTSLESALTGDASTAYIVAEVIDEDAARSFFREFGLHGDENHLAGRGVSVNFIEGALILSSGMNGIALSDGATLDQDPDFQQVLTSLPADGYYAVIYGEDPIALAGLVVPQAVGQGIISESNDLAIGLTLLDGDTYTLDTAQLPVEGSLPVGTPVDPEFARFVPASANLFVQGHDLSGLIERGIVAAEQAANLILIANSSYGIGADIKAPTPMPSPAVRDQLSSALGLMGIDLDEDVLSWMTGEYALIGRTDLREIGSSLIRSQPAGQAIQGNYDFGLLIELTDADKAQQLAEHLDTLANQVAGARPQEIAVGSAIIGGVEVTTLDVYAILSTYPQTDKTAIGFMMGVNDDLFFIGTRGVVTDLLNGSESITTTAAYGDSQRYVLPNATSIWYADGEGFLIGMGTSPLGIVGLALAGPSIGSVFSNIISSLEQGATPTPTPSPTPSPTPDVDSLLSPLDYAIANIRHSTISATITPEGVQLIRFTVTLNTAP